MAIAVRELREQGGIERDGSAGRDRIEPILLVSVTAQHDGPSSIALLEEVVGAAPAGDVAQHALDLAALRDLDLGAGHGPRAGEVDGRAAEHVIDARAALIALLADSDDFLERALEPGCQHPP